MRDNTKRFRIWIDAIVDDVYEPFLLQQGYLKRTARGRLVTENTYEYLDIEK